MESNNVDKGRDAREADELYQIYKRVQSGDKTALDELFQTKRVKQVSKLDEDNRKERMSNLDNLLDSEFYLENEKNRQEEEWTSSSCSGVEFAFPCLNKMVSNMKKTFLQEWKNTGYENGAKINDARPVKFYGSAYDVSDINEMMYEIVLEIFHAKTDESGFVSLYGKKNVKCPICDGVSLLRNIFYFVGIKVNNRAKISHLDIYDVEEHNEESDENRSLLDKHSFEVFLKEGNGIEFVNSASGRLPMYGEYLEWLQKNDVHWLFKINAFDVHALIKTIMDCKETFEEEAGAGMRFVTQETLRGLIKERHGIDVRQENISRDFLLVEQRLLDHLFYSLNYSIGKAKKSEGVFEKESERILLDLNKKSYIRMFSEESNRVYDASVRFLDGGIFDGYLRTVKRHEDLISDVISLEKGKKRYDMINLLLGNGDLVDGEQETLADIARCMVTHYQKEETKSIKNILNKCKLIGFDDWDSRRWETELKNDVLNLRLWSSEDIKKPIRHRIDKGKLMIYCGYMNLYFCDTEKKTYYSLPKDRRVITRSNKNHEISIYCVN